MEGAGFEINWLENEVALLVDETPLARLKNRGSALAEWSGLVKGAAKG
jgi:hypothetical protein